MICENKSLNHNEEVETDKSKFSTGLGLHFGFHVRLQQICQVHGEELANIVQLDTFSELLGLTFVERCG